MASTHFRHNLISITIIRPCSSPAAVARLEGSGRDPACTVAAQTMGAVQAHAEGGCAGARAAHSWGCEPAVGTLEVGLEAGAESPLAAQMEGPEFVWLQLCFFCNFYLFLSFFYTDASA